MLVHASHTLNADGTRMGYETSVHMTALDIHINFECDKVRSNCSTCGKSNMSRANFEKNHKNCYDWNGEIWKDVREPGRH